MAEPDHGPTGIRQFLREQLPNTKNVVRECNRKLKEVDTILPEVPEGQSVPWSTIGTAIDLRIRYYFSGAELPQKISPAHAASLLIFNLASQDNTEPEPLRGVDRTLAIDGREERLFVGIPLDATDAEVNAYFRDAAVLKRNILRLFDYFSTEVQSLEPAGRRLSYDEEDLLARYCYVLPSLNLLAVVSSKAILYRRLFMNSESKFATAELLRSVEDAWVDDIRSLSWAFYDRVFPEGWMSNSAIPNPTFDDGSSGDLIVDGCLVEIKTTKKPVLRRDWLYQLLQYASLDREDRYNIREVGVYFTRQQEFARWPIVDLLSALAEGNVPSLQSMRDACAAIASQRA